jgi:2-methylcitrate dehydratase PrpD
MHKIRVYVDEQVDSLYPKTISMKIKATKKDGGVIDLWPRDPLGHVNKPMSDDDVRKSSRRPSNLFTAKKKLRVSWTAGGGSKKLRLRKLPRL